MVKLNKIYTRTGDDGTTGLVDGSRRPKHGARIEAIGVVDEANSTIGWVGSLLAASDFAQDLYRIQNDLFDLGADLATPAEDSASDPFAPSDMVLRIVPSQVTWLEQVIDRLNAHIEPLDSFILPGGTDTAARAHVARATVRRAERAMTQLAAEEPVNPAALAYINRLSDYLFVFARMLNENGARDVKWVPGANR